MKKIIQIFVTDDAFPCMFQPYKIVCENLPALLLLKPLPWTVTVINTVHIYQLRTNKTKKQTMYFMYFHEWVKFCKLGLFT